MAKLKTPLPVPPARLTDAFGARKSFNAGEYKTGAMHGGQDIAPPEPGQKDYPCRAVGTGRVVATRVNGRRSNIWGGKAIYNDAAGNYVITEHVAPANDPFLSAFGLNHTRIWVGYNHLDEVSAVVGWQVTEDTILATVGRTGAATGEHVHIDVFLDNPSLGNFAFDRRVDPMRVLDVRATKTNQEADPAPVNHYQEDSEMRLTRDVTNGGRVYLHTGRGSVYVSQPNHVKILQRVIASGSEVEDINELENAWVIGYIAAAGHSDRAAMEKAIREEFAKLDLNVSVDMEDVIGEITFKQGQ